jgi:hypothetical protein
LAFAVVAHAQGPTEARPVLVVTIIVVTSNPRFAA